MLVAEYVVSSTVLHSTLAEFPDISLRHEAQYRTEDGIVRLFFWVSNVDHESFEAAVEDDPTVTNFERLDTVESRDFCRVDFTPDGYRKSTFPIWSENNAVLLEAQGSQDGWRIRMRVPDRATLVTLREAYVDQGCSFSLRSLYREDDVADELEASVSPSQREALVTAYEAGYFEVPREITQAELATRLNVSSQSVSERIRRAISAMIESMLSRE